MFVRDFMSHPAATCSPEATLQDAAREMDRRNVGSLVVVADDGHVVGLITDRDITVKAVAAGRDISTTVADVMSKAVANILSDADVFEAVQKMARRGVRRLPVVSVSGHVEGMVTVDDVTRAMTEEMAVLRRMVVTQLSGGPGWDET